MARQPNFTPPEDRIILRYPGAPAEVVNAALEAAGFPKQTAARITQRRYYLTTPTRSGNGGGGRRGKSKIARLEARRTAINNELSHIEDRRSFLITELHEVTSALSDEVAVVASEMPPET